MMKCISIPPMAKPHVEEPRDLSCHFTMADQDNMRIYKILFGKIYPAGYPLTGAGHHTTL
jgi:hypothetical protein